MLKVERPTVQQNLNFITINIALEGGGEAQSFFHMGSLIIFVRDCRTFTSSKLSAQIVPRLHEKVGLVGSFMKMKFQ